MCSSDLAVRRHHRADPERSIQQAHSNLLALNHVQHIQQVGGARIRQHHEGGVEAITLLQEDQVHVRTVMRRGRGKTMTRALLRQREADALVLTMCP